VDELVSIMDTLDWSAGVQIRQQRVAKQRTSTVAGADNACEAAFVGDFCLPDLTKSSFYDRAEFGLNFTHPREPLDNPFKWSSYVTLGGTSTIAGRMQGKYDASGCAPCTNTNNDYACGHERRSMPTRA
jgi:hypothetical protein